MVTTVTVTKKTKLHDLRTNSHRKWGQSPGKKYPQSMRGAHRLDHPTSQSLPIYLEKYVMKFSQSSSSKSSPKSTHSSPRQWAIKLSLPLPLKYQMHCQGNRGLYRCGRPKSIGMYNFALYMYGKKSYWTWCSLGSKRENLNQISC